eukprot:365556-Chlamydomonas_euryale.AAC.2
MTYWQDALAGWLEWTGGGYEVVRRRSDGGYGGFSARNWREQGARGGNQGGEGGASCVQGWCVMPAMLARSSGAFTCASPAADQHPELNVNLTQKQHPELNQHPCQRPVNTAHTSSPRVECLPRHTSTIHCRVGRLVPLPAFTCPPPLSLLLSGSVLASSWQTLRLRRSPGQRQLPQRDAEPVDLPALCAGQRARDGPDAGHAHQGGRGAHCVGQQDHPAQPGPRPGAAGHLVRVLAHQHRRVLAERAGVPAFGDGVVGDVTGAMGPRTHCAHPAVQRPGPDAGHVQGHAERGRHSILGPIGLPGFYSFGENLLMLFIGFYDSVDWDSLEPLSGLGLDPEEVQAYRLYGILIFAIYSLVSTVLLGNLLIAIITNRYRPDEAKAQASLNFAEVVDYHAFQVRGCSCPGFQGLAPPCNPEPTRFKLFNPSLNFAEGVGYHAFQVRGVLLSRAVAVLRTAALQVRGVLLSRAVAVLRTAALQCWGTEVLRCCNCRRTKQGRAKGTQCGAGWQVNRD